MSMAKHPERDAEIVAQRKAGRTLRSIAKEFGLSVESDRRIEVVAWRREQKPKDSIELSVRTRNAILNAGWYPDVTGDEHAQRFFDEGPGAAQFEKAFAQHVAELGRAAFLELPNCGKKTLAEVETWLEGHGLRWSAQVDLTTEDYRAEG